MPFPGQGRVGEESGAWLERPRFFTGSCGVGGGGWGGSWEGLACPGTMWGACEKGQEETQARRGKKVFPGLSHVKVLHRVARRFYCLRHA